jgi:ribosomal protein L11 methyltransferase
MTKKRRPTRPRAARASTLPVPGRDGTTVARLRADQASAWRIVHLFTERFDPADTAAAVIDAADGGWIVELYLGSVADRDAVSQVVADAVGAGAKPALTFETLVEPNWVAASLAGLDPVAAGRFVMHGRHDRARVAVNRIGIEIEAALAFGTGHHGTTRGCLLALDRLARSHRPRRIFDIGTGSGVLAIAAAKGTRHRVVAGDIDPRAVAVAKGNARINGVGSLVEVIRANGLLDRRLRGRAPYDLILANILLEPLKRLAAPMARLLATRGRVVLSGLLPAQSAAALAAYRTQGLRLQHRILLDGWATLVLAR